MSGINLIYSITPDEADERHKIYHLRNRLIHFLKEEDKKKEDAGIRLSQNEGLGADRLVFKESENNSKKMIAIEEEGQ